MHMFAQILGNIMTSQSVHEEGRSAGYRGRLRADNPYRRGWARIGGEQLDLIHKWDDGWCIGWAQRNTDLFEKRQDDLRSDARMP